MANKPVKENDKEKKLKNGNHWKSIAKYSASIICVILSFQTFKYFHSGQKSELVQGAHCADTLKYWGVCIWNYNPNGNLRSMNRVFDRLGYVSVNASEGDDWDVLWSIEFPFLQNKLEIFNPVYQPLRQHQRVNHFPGFNYITDKSFMTSRNRDIKYILPGFTFPRMKDDFKAYVEAHPKARFVEKGIRNRNIKLVEKDEIKYDKSWKFYQHFMEKPFLVDGHFMDFAVYVLVSSIKPLRVYRFQEVHLRFCPKPYYPFHPDDLDKYVISESLIFFLDLEKRKHYNEIYGYSITQSIEDYFRMYGHNVTELWRKIDEAITLLILNNEKNIAAEVCDDIFNKNDLVSLTKFLPFSDV